MNNCNSIINIAIVDDEALIVMLLSDYFAKNTEIVVSFTANDGLQLIEYLRKAESLPDIVLLDMQMKVLNGTDTATILKKEFSDIKIIIVSAYYKKSFLGYMLKLGINAFLPKEIHPNQLVQVINDVFTKGFYFLEEQVAVMRKQISTQTPAPYFIIEEFLTDRETKILKLICQQYTSLEIGEKLCISARTVEGHKTNLFLKTSTRNLAGLVIWAVQNGIINIDDFILPKY